MRIEIKATRDELAKLGEVLTYSFQENDYFNLGSETGTFIFEIDDNPAIYEKQDGEAICWSVILEESSSE